MTERSITPEDLAFADEVVTRWPTIFYGGSYVVNGIEAGDIDLVVPHALWPEVRAGLSGRIEKVQKDIPTEEEQNTEEDRLVCVYRRGAVDLLVIRDAYVKSYRQAVDAMKAAPEMYRTRAARVRIHVYFADLLRSERGWEVEEVVMKRRRLKAGKSSGTGEYK